MLRIIFFLFLSTLIITSCTTHNTPTSSSSKDALSSATTDTPKAAKTNENTPNNITIEKNTPIVHTITSKPTNNSNVIKTRDDKVLLDLNNMPQPKIASVSKVDKPTQNKPKSNPASPKIENPQPAPKIDIEEVKQAKIVSANSTPNTTNNTISTPKDEPVKVDTPTPPPFNHDAWDNLLRKHVNTSGSVNYEGFKKDKSKLEDYLKALADNPIQNDWSRNKKMAYWINAYNAFTVKLIVDNHPVSSITKLHNGKPWDVKWIKLGSKTYSLNNIENDILRPQYKDPRIHFAVNCAAKSCPPLLNRAWTASNLSTNFEKQAKAFINNANFNSIAANKVEISKIFEWYAVDFGNIIDYLNKYSTTTINSNAKVGYKEYDWGLNK